MKVKSEMVKRTGGEEELMEFKTELSLATSMAIGKTQMLEQELYSKISNTFGQAIFLKMQMKISHLLLCSIRRKTSL
jgi:hypothetical protein